MSKEQIKQWIKEKNMKSVDAVKSALKELFAETIQEMLEGEIESTLGYAKHVAKNKRRWIGGLKKWGGEPLFSVLICYLLQMKHYPLKVESGSWLLPSN
nr:hypothetical protein [Lysinibacillus sp. SDF0063]